MGGGREGRCGRVVPRRTQIMKKTILIWMGLACGLVGVLEARTWTSGDGRKLDAEFISATDRYVTVRREADGKRFTMELAKISEADREWVAAKLVELAGPEKKPATGLFVGKLTEEWEYMEYGSLKFRFYGGKGLDKKAARFPVVVFLHGRGSGGSDNEKQLSAAPKQFAEDDWYQGNPSFVFAPQCPDDTKGWNGEYMDDVLGLVKAAVEHLPVDPDRLYITGLSMGGFGTFQAIAQAPDLFAAAVPVCGGGRPGTARAIKDVAIWAHHGEADPTVSVELTRRMVTALEEVKGNVRYTEYDEASGIKHDAWTPCYSNPEVFEWMFAQRKGKRVDAGKKGGEK